VKLDDLKRFRQLDSKCPGHPEYRWTSGVETTTGPLGQGVGNSVGMAMARVDGVHFNRPGFEMFDYDVYALCGDGCMMEGVSGEAASLAGHLKLSNLCWIYDNNHITIEGNTALAFSEDVATRFIGTAGTSCAWAMRTIWSGWNARFDISRAPRPARRSSSWTATSPTARPTSRTPARRMASRWAKKKCAWPSEKLRLAAKMRSSWCRKACTSTFRDGDGKARQGHAGRCLDGAFDEYKAEVSGPGRSTRPHAAPQLPEGWDKDLPVFPAGSQGPGRTRFASG
jgi:transketolase